jgi:6-phosphogluconolactonase
MKRLTTVGDPEAVARRAATDIARHLTRAREQRAPVHLALSGGTTPGRSYELLATEMADWDGIEIWFVDERCVEPEDERSNYRLAAETLLAPAGIPATRVHRMLGEMGPDVGADLYALELTARVAPDEHGVPVLDLCVLGVGPDGHVASLFPDSPTLRAGDRAICLGVEDSPKPPPERITLSLAMLRAARRCLLIATGAGKADAIAAMLGEPSEHVPASLLRRERLSVIVDDAASPAPRGP